MSFKSFRLILSILNKIIPTKTISTFFGLGFLPVWQQYWSSTCGLCFLYFILFVKGNFFLYDASVIPLLPETAMHAIILGVIIFLVGTLSVLGFHQIKPNAASTAEITIHSPVFQLFTVGFCLPPTITMSSKLYGIYNFMCIDVLPCASWVITTMKFVTGATIPLFFFVLIQFFSPWPITFLQLRFNHAFSIMLEGLITFLYTLLLMYFLSFVFFNGSVIDAKDILKSIFITAY